MILHWNRKPVANTTSSILILNGTEITGSPELSTIDILTESDSPLVVLLSGSRSNGLRIESEEYPLLSNKELFVLSLKYPTPGVNSTLISCEPLGNDRSNLISADQLPSESVDIEETVKVLKSPSIEKVRAGFSKVPCLLINAEPLSEIKEPVILKNLPGKGWQV